MKQQVLIVDDERAIREMVCLAMGVAGFACIEASNAHEASEAIRRHEPDLLLLDWMLPGISGVDFARQLRREPQTVNLPIIMLTAKTEESDMLRGLESGVDDYITKPFSTRELVARINALLRRTGNASDNGDVLQAAGLELDAVAQRVSAHGQELHLGPMEYRLLKFFMERPERVFSRTQLLNHVWGENVYVEERTVDVHIRRLRKALAQHESLIQTVRGSGYRFSTK